MGRDKTAHSCGWLGNLPGGGDRKRDSRPGLPRAACGLAAVAVAAALLATAGAQAQSPPVTTTYGVVQGNSPDANGIISFKGIPFAAPPVGPLRWRPPQPPAPYAGVLGAFNYGNSCISAFRAAPNPSESEDCLTVNVWTPNLNPGTLKPVMVYIYGGGFQFGYSSNPTLDGTNLAGHDVVVANFNYRLGALGFLAAPQLDAEQGTSGNYGLMDQIAALTWVKQNIAAFGGDPNRVTVFGESAGSHSIGLLLSSPPARGLINAAIFESGVWWETGALGSIATHAEALAQGAAFLAQFGSQDPRSIDALTVMSADPWDYTVPPIYSIAPNVDGRVLPTSPAEAYERGATPNIPMMGGWNAAEYFPFTAFAVPHSTPAEFQQSAANLFGSRCLPQFEVLYPITSDENQVTASAFQLDGDLIIAEQTWELLTVTRRPGAPNAYAYNFTYTSPYSPVAAHAADIPFEFGTPAVTVQYFNPNGPAPTAADQNFSDIVQAYWTNFAKTGNPNGPGLPAWPAFTGVGGQVLDLNATPFARANTDEKRFQFIASYRSHGRFPAAWRTLGAPGNQYPGLGCSAPVP